MPFAHGDPSWRDRAGAPAALDCSTFVCRVVLDALEYPDDVFYPDPAWLLGHLCCVDTPIPGDLVGYRRSDQRHVMLYLGSGLVIGACDIAGEVTIRPFEYESSLGDRQWKLVATPFRLLSV